MKSQLAVPYTTIIPTQLDINKNNTNIYSKDHIHDVYTCIMRSKNVQYTHHIYTQYFTSVLFVPFRKIWFYNEAIMARQQPFRE